MSKSKEFKWRKEELSEKVKLRQNKYLNNRIEQDHRIIKWLVKPGRGCKSFNTARRTIKGYEILHMMKKGQIEKVEKGAVRERVKFIAKIFGPLHNQFLLQGFFCPQ